MQRKRSEVVTAIPSCPFPHLHVLFPYKFICRSEVSIGPQPPGHISSPSEAVLDFVPEPSTDSISERLSSCPGYSELGLEPGSRLRPGKTSSLDSLSPTPDPKKRRGQIQTKIHIQNIPLWDSRLGRIPGHGMQPLSQW